MLEYLYKTFKINRSLVRLLILTVVYKLYDTPKASLHRFTPYWNILKMLGNTRLHRTQTDQISART
jgi:hypothetical protein